MPVIERLARENLDEIEATIQTLRDRVRLERTGNFEWPFSLAV